MVIKSKGCKSLRSHSGQVRPSLHSGDVKLMPRSHDPSGQEQSRIPTVPLSDVPGADWSGEVETSTETSPLKLHNERLRRQSSLQKARTHRIAMLSST